MEAGKLRHRVRFDKKMEQSDPAGGVLSDWSTVANGSFSRAADISAVGGSESLQAQRLTGMLQAVIEVRRDSLTRTLDSSWRAVKTVNDVPQMNFAIKVVNQFVRNGADMIRIEAVQGAADA